MRDLIQLMRPRQWTKNLVVLAALFFALGDRHQPGIHSDLPALFATAIGAALIFSLIASACYIVNDIRDAPQDRLHPDKRNRPVAAGAVAPGTAMGWAVMLLAVGLGGASLWYSPIFIGVIAGYAALQIVYTIRLKRLPFFDVIFIALGFVLRAIAGAAAVAVKISPWLLLCTFLLALFLALCKRRNELVVLGAAAIDHRPSLAPYSRHFLDQAIATIAVATIICYSIYTIWPDTVEKFGTRALACTIPFVVFGILRYRHLVYRREMGGQPEEVLLADKPLIVDLVLYVVVIGLIFFIGGSSAHNIQGVLSPMP